MSDWLISAGWWLTKWVTLPILLLLLLRWGAMRWREADLARKRARAQAFHRYMQSGKAKDRPRAH